MRIALAHDSFTQLGGAERVVDFFHELFPNAPVFVLVFDRAWKEHYRGWDIRASWLQVIYNIFPKFPYLLPLIPFAISSMDFSGYDVVLSSSSGFAKNIKVPTGCVHINYCHTTARFLWQNEDYLRQEVPKFLLPLARILLTRMKRWDYDGAQRVTHFIANSAEVKSRIKKYYGRESDVIYPGIDNNFWRPSKAKGNYFLIAGRLQAHKYSDIIVEIFNTLGLPLHIVGAGRQEGYLKSIAKFNITFFGKISDELLRDEYSGARALIYPQLEDFGLMPLEAASCGTPTLAYGHGGALETIIPGKTGEFFYSHQASEIENMVRQWRDDKYDQDVLTNHAAQFSKEVFKQQVAEYVNRAYENRG